MTTTSVRSLVCFVFAVAAAWLAAGCSQEPSAAAGGAQTPPPAAAAPAKPAGR